MTRTLRAVKKERQARVAELLLAGHTQREIAVVRGVGLGTVKAETAAVRAGWKARHTDAIDQQVAEESARLDAVAARHLL